MNCVVTLKINESQKSAAYYCNEYRKPNNNCSHFALNALTMSNSGIRGIKSLAIPHIDFINIFTNNQYLTSNNNVFGTILRVR